MSVLRFRKEGIKIVESAAGWRKRKTVWAEGVLSKDGLGQLLSAGMKRGHVWIWES